MEIARLAGRLAAAVLGLIGVVVGLVVNVAYSGAHDLFIAGSNTHGFVGLGLIFLAFIGAIAALFNPRLGAALMAIGGAGFFYPVGLFALIASPFILLGALLAFIDRGPSSTAKKTS